MRIGIKAAGMTFGFAALCCFLLSGCGSGEAAKENGTITLKAGQEDSGSIPRSILDDIPVSVTQDPRGSINMDTADPEKKGEDSLSGKEGTGPAEAAGKNTGSSQVWIPSSLGDEWPKEGLVLTAVNLRAEPDSESSVVTQIGEKETVSILGPAGNGWYRIKSDAGEGCALCKYVIPMEYVRMNPAGRSDRNPDLSRLDPSKPVIALTFDDGPKPGVTDRILNALDKVGGKATFFMIGVSVRGDGNALVRRMAETGHELGNHTYNHDNLSRQEDEEVRLSIRECDYMIETTCGKAPTVLRPPGGNSREETLNIMAQLGYASILWSVDTLDWDTKDTQSTVDAILEKASDGQIVLMHDRYEETAAAMEIVIPKLAAQGYQFVTVSEMAALKGTGLTPGREYRSIR